MSGILLALALATTAPPDVVQAPRRAAHAYFDAVARGDAEAALALVDRPSDADRVAVRAAAGTEAALVQLEELATSRFGKRGDLGVAARHRRLLAAVARAPVEVKGDRAVVRPAGERPVRLRRVDGAWKVVSPADRWTGEERKTLEEALRRTEAAAKDLGERIRAGAFETAREAREALRKALGGSEPEGVPL